MTQTPTPEQLDSAIVEKQEQIEYWGNRVKELPSFQENLDQARIDLFALRFTAKVLGEPSENAGRIGVDIRNIQENQGYKDTNYIFKEMIKVIAKECADV